jgi:hypothetical protein
MGARRAFLATPRKKWGNEAMREWVNQWVNDEMW